MSILTLTGWTQPTDALASLVPGAHGFDYSEYQTPEKAIEALRIFSDVSCVVGWSMGGWLAMQAIAAGALSPQSLLLIAPPFQFVNDNTFRDGMPPETFNQFRENYRADAERTSRRFHGLIAKGDRHFHAVMDKLSHHHDVTNTTRWLPWLDSLAQRPLHDIAINTPVIRLLHGEADAIVPVAQSTHFAHRHAHLSRSVWKEVSHAPHLHDNKRFLDEVKAAYVY